MTPFRFVQQALAWILVLELGLPQSAAALRPVGLEESETTRQEVVHQLSAPTTTAVATASGGGATALVGPPPWLTRARTYVLRRIVHVAYEMTPFFGVGGLKDVIREFLPYLGRAGFDTTVVLPGHKSIWEAAKKAGVPLNETGRFVDVPTVAHGPVRFRIVEASLEGLRLVFLVNDQYFQRGYDGDDSFLFHEGIMFCAAAAAAIGVLNLNPDVIHAHEWQAATTLSLIARVDRYRQPNAARILHIHNLDYQGPTPRGADFDSKRRELAALGFADDAFTPDGFEFDGAINLLKSGILDATKIATVGRRYRDETLTEEFGARGLYRILAFREADYAALPNAVDRSLWDPATAADVDPHFSADDPAPKAVHKERLQRELGLNVDSEAPLFQVRSRLTGQKGIDELIQRAPEFLRDSNVQLAILGEGVPALVAQLRELAAAYPGRVAFVNRFDEPLARRFDLGADFLLALSRFEPFGLTVPFAMAFGGISIVRDVGGFGENVLDPRDDAAHATGFKYFRHDPKGMMDAIPRALELWRNPEARRAMQQRAMRAVPYWDDRVPGVIDFYVSGLEKIGRQPVEAAGLEERAPALGQVRSALSDLPTYAIPTAWVWATLDLLLRQTRRSGSIDSQLRAEYQETQRWLKQQDSDLAAVRAIERLVPTRPSSVEVFRISTRNALYVLAVQTQEPHVSGTAWAHVGLPELSSMQDYRLEEVVTGEVFPWDPPYHYLGTYLRGETDRFGSSGEQERWGIRPGDHRGDFQLFRVVPAAELDTQIRWDDLMAAPQPGMASPPTLVRHSGRQQHTLLRDAQLGMAADVITGRAVPGGQFLMVAFPNGNAGVGFRNDGSFTVEQIRSIVRAQGTQRGVEFQVSMPGSRVEFGPGDFLLDSVRHLREWNSLDAGRSRARVFQEFTEAYRNLPRAIHIALHREGISLAELARRILPRIFYRTTAQDQRLYVFRLTLGGHLYVVEMTFPVSYQVTRSPDRFSVQAQAGEPLRWRMAVTTDFPPLTLLTRDQLIGEEWLAQAQGPSVLREEVEDLEFLAFQEFFAAGSHRFLQFFGRDTMYWLRMFAPLLTPAAHESVLQGILERVSSEGRLPSVEEMHDQTAFELMERFCWACRQPEAARAQEVVKASRALRDFAQQKVPPTDLKYGVLDVDFMLLPAIADYLRRQDVRPQDKAAFLARAGRQGVGNVIPVLRNMNWIIQQAQRYTEAVQGGSPWPSGLLGVEREGDFGNWRDVQYGLGYGLFPADVNAELLPAALRATREVLSLVGELPGARQRDPNRLAKAQELAHLAAWLQTPEMTASLSSAWQEVSGRFSVALTAEEIRERLSRFLQQHVQAREREWLRSQPLGAGVRLGHFLQAGGPVPAILQGGYRYFPVSLDRHGRPVPVVASDNVLALMDDQLTPQRLIEILTPLLLPYPVGLWTPVGFMIASPSLSNDERLWREIGTQSYGGGVIYGWQMGHLRHGLYRQMMRADLVADPRLREILYSAFEAAARASPPEEVGHELWTWEVAPGGFRRVAFGDLPGHNDESNPVQLWSLSAADALAPRVQAVARQSGLRVLSHEQMLDGLAEARTRYAQATAGLEEHPAIAPQPAATPSLPGIAQVSTSLPPGGGGVNIVVANQTSVILQSGYPFTVIGGQVIALPAATKRSPPPDNAYTRAGARLQIIPEMDVQGEMESLAWANTVDSGEFEAKVSELMRKLEDALRDVKVVFLHSYMTMPFNPVATEVLRRLARQHRDMRFVSFNHNVLPNKAQPWVLRAITDMDPFIEYVGVSRQVADDSLRVFGLSQWPWAVGVVRNSVSVVNFFDISPKVLSEYFRLGFHQADLLLFYPARLIETKEIAGAIAAVHHARQKGYDVRLVISTTGYEGQIPVEARAYHQHLLDLMRHFGLTEREAYIYLHSPSPDDLKSQREVRDWFFLTHALLFSTQQETAGIPLKEAKMAEHAIFHTDLAVLNQETEGYSQAYRFPPRQGWESEDRYGTVIAERIVAFLRSQEGAHFRGICKAKQNELAQSFEAFLGPFSAWLNVPAVAERAIRVGNRNFPHDSGVEQAIAEAAQFGYGAFEINFEGFSPSDLKPETIQKIREAAAGLRLSLRLTDFASLSDGDVPGALERAAVVAMETGAAGIVIPARGLSGPRAQTIVAATQWAREESARRSQLIPEVLFSIENAWRGDTGWQVVPPDVLNEYFAGRAVGLTLWIDGFEPRGPSAVDETLRSAERYLNDSRLQLATVNVGLDFFSRTGNQSVAFAKVAGGVLRWAREHGWRGSLIAQTMIDQGRGLQAGLLNLLVAKAYMPGTMSDSLDTNGFVPSPPSMAIAPVIRDQAGLEEGLPMVAEIVPALPPLAFQPGVPQVMDAFAPSTVQAGVVHVVDPESAGNVGLLVGRVQTDPVVLIARDAEHERQLREAGFSGDIMRLSAEASLEQTRNAAAALFPQLAPRYYRDDDRTNLRLWLAWLLERYEVTAINLDQAMSIVESMTLLRAA